MAMLYPSLISGDLLDLRHQIALLDPYCDGYHLDLMDGHFVPNITWGPAFINAIAEATTKKCWVHLMATNPQQWIDSFTIPPQSMVDFHIETAINHQALIEHIQSKQWIAGITLNPKTPLSTVTPLLTQVDYVLVMSVEPGFSGQSFMPIVLEKIKELVAYRSTYNLTFEIAIDGGISSDNIRDVVHAGVDHIAAAAAIFAQHDPVAALQALKKECL